MTLEEAEKAYELARFRRLIGVLGIRAWKEAVENYRKALEEA